MCLLEVPLQRVQEHHSTLYLSDPKCRIGNGADTIYMKKTNLLLAFALVVGMTTTMTAAPLTSSPVTKIYPGACPSIAMTVDEEDVAVMQPAVTSVSGKDVEVTIFGEKFAVEKQFTIPNVVVNWEYRDDYSKGVTVPWGLWIESADMQSVVVSKNFFVKNNKWCVTFLHRSEVTGEIEFLVIDEDGNNLGTLPESESDPCIFLDTFIYGTPFLLLLADDETGGNNYYDYFQLYTFTGNSGVENKKVASISAAYPNPLAAGQTLNVTFENEADDATYFTVLDMRGRQVYRRKIKSGETSCQISGARFGHGQFIYTIVYGNGESVSGKLLSE